MKRSVVLLCCILSITLQCKSVFGGNPLSKIVTYKTIDEVALKLHFFYPPNHKKSDQATAILLFHGGGWYSGTPEQFYPQSQYFASRGLVAVSVQYRVNKTNGTTPKECVKDGKSAMRWLKIHAKEYGIDPDQILAGGGSAGGHIAAALATVKGFNEEVEDPSVSCRPSALVLFNPVLHNGEEGYGFGRVKDYWEAFSPFHNIDKNTPPTLLLVGTEDTFFPPHLAKEFQKNMKTNGVRCDLKLYEGQEHGFFNKGKNPEMFKETLLESDRFLTSLGYLQPLPSSSF
ncbi:alpha/beta hydrolase [Flammeovirga pacifica]|uniref:Peptidase S9 n=1 Tax=Flammeovirga pacifica TaxID=915059 RepID=A0A1S1YUX8_FLAPC|nr:alpha/beta hydrolase [Flammeovirga pacifica]OHX64673.1 peptidase S9 [Flammeovirga pacifica]